MPFILAALQLSNNYKLAFAIVFGIALGFVLVRCDLVWLKTVRDMLLLRNGALLNCILAMFAVGIIAYAALEHGGVLSFCEIRIPFWPAVIGGFLTAVGFAFCPLSPFSAVCSLAGGRLYAVWAMLGMALAIPAVSSVSRFLQNTIYSWSTPIDNEVAGNGDLFSMSSPALWVSGIFVGLILLVHFTIGEENESK